jgi:hypothetical protein
LQIEVKVDKKGKKTSYYWSRYWNDSRRSSKIH